MRARARAHFLSLAAFCRRRRRYCRLLLPTPSANARARACAISSIVDVCALEQRQQENFRSGGGSCKASRAFALKRRSMSARRRVRLTGSRVVDARARAPWRAIKSDESENPQRSRISKPPPHGSFELNVAVVASGAARAHAHDTTTTTHDLS